mmetsp:Transcript_30680/g.94970  ORF Transcript_30680/g.94970 Transcript_30680/m.94970 type:complete len:165 (-) Transcript_30680:102-596(-)
MAPVLPLLPPPPLVIPQIVLDATPPPILDDAALTALWTSHFQNGPVLDPPVLEMAPDYDDDSSGDETDASPLVLTVAASEVPSHLGSIVMGGVPSWHLDPRVDGFGVSSPQATDEVEESVAAAPRTAVEDAHVDATNAIFRAAREADERKRRRADTAEANGAIP